MEERIIRDLLRTFGVTDSRTGCGYLVEAVLLAGSEPDRLTNICSGIYIPIADRHHVKMSTVEKGIRSIRDLIMENDGGRTLCRITGCTVWRHRDPYPRELISIFADFAAHPIYLSDKR